MRISHGTIVAIFFILVGLYVFVTASSWPEFNAKALPMIVSGITFLLGVNQLRLELQSKGKTAVEAEQKAAARLQWQRFGAAMAWLVGLITGIYLLGFIVAGAIFCLLYLKTHVRSWLRSAFYSTGVSAVFYGVFIYTLKVMLHEGILFSLFR